MEGHGNEQAVRRDNVAPCRRIVLLGASNLVRAFPTVIDHGRRIWGSPLEVIGAMGHGRSYGRSSCVLGRTLPSIRGCRLWGTLRRRPWLPTAALITDVGNDILYDRTPDHIITWVYACVRRLQPTKTRIIVTELPLESVASLGALRFLAMRNLLYPWSRITLNVARARAEETNERLAEMAQQHALTLVKPRRHWYGWDPIHIRYRYLDDAWSDILGHWTNDALTIDRPLTRSDRKRVRSARAELRYWFGVSWRSRQPSAVLSDGSTISLY